MRGWLDRAVGGVGLRRGRRDPDRLYVGDALDFWRVEALEPQRSIAVIQAGTGVGKSLAYSVPAIALALARNTRVMISTAPSTPRGSDRSRTWPSMA